MSEDTKCQCNETWKAQDLAKHGHQWWCGLSPEAVDGRLMNPEKRLAEARRAERQRALHLDEPWSVPYVLARLADAADHLLKDHDCDAHGYEAIAAARDAARRMLTVMPEFEARSAPTSAEQGPFHRHPATRAPDRRRVAEETLHAQEAVGAEDVETWARRIADMTSRADD